MTSGPITSWQIEGEKVEVVTDFLFLGSKITADGDCGHEVRRWWLLGRKAKTNLDIVLKRKDATLPTKIHVLKVFPVESWTIKKAECWRIDAFELWCWTRLLRVPWTTRRSNQPILKEINPEYSLEDWCYSWRSNTSTTWCEEPTHWKRPWCQGRLKAEEEEADRGWDGWMVSLIQWTWTWANSGRWWGTRRPGVWPSIGSQSDTTKWLNNSNKKPSLSWVIQVPCLWYLIVNK